MSLKGSINNYNPQQLPRILSGSSELTAGTALRPGGGAVQAVNMNLDRKPASVRTTAAKFGSKKKGGAGGGGPSSQVRQSGLGNGAANKPISMQVPPAKASAYVSGTGSIPGGGPMAQAGASVCNSITYHPSQLPPELSKKLKKFLLTIKNGEQSIETQR